MKVTSIALTVYLQLILSVSLSSSDLLYFLINMAKLQRVGGFKAEVI